MARYTFLTHRLKNWVKFQYTKSEDIFHMLHNKTSNKKSIFIVGGFGVPNWGDELILDRLLNSPLFSANEIEQFYIGTANSGVSSHVQREHKIITVDALNASIRIYPDELKEFDVNRIRNLAERIAADPQMRKNNIYLRLIYKAIDESVAVHFCGGGYLFDAWKVSIISLAFIVFLAKAMGKPVTASGVSPVSKSTKGFELILSMINDMDVLDVRDCIDPRFIESRRTTHPDSTFLSCDDAVAFCSNDVEDCREDTCRVHIQLFETPMAIHKPRMEHCVEVLKGLSKAIKIECYLINHVGPAQKDWTVMQDIAELLIEEGISVKQIDLSLATPEEGLRELAKGNVAIVGRYHAMIGHLLCAVPTLTIDTGSPIFDRHRSAFPLVSSDLLFVSNLHDVDDSVEYLLNAARAPRKNHGFSGSEYEYALQQKKLAYNAIIKCWSLN